MKKLALLVAMAGLFTMLAGPPAQAAAPQPAAPAVLAAWPRSAQLTTAFLLGVCATLLAVHVVGSLRLASRPSEFDRGAVLAYRIDLNRATRAELLQFLRRHRLAVQASVAPGGAPQAAVVGIGISDACEIVFDTLTTTR